MSPAADAVQGSDLLAVDEESDVIAACQLWLDLDFPDRSDTGLCQEQPEASPQGPATTTGVPWTLENIRELPPVLDLPEAAAVLRIGRTSAYALAKRGAFPVPVLRAGKLYRVPTAGLLGFLGLAAASPPDRVDVPCDFVPGACTPVTSGASIYPTS